MRSNNITGTIIKQGKYSIKEPDKSIGLFEYIIFSKGRIITRELRKKAQWTQNIIPQQANIIS